MNIKLNVLGLVTTLFIWSCGAPKDQTTNNKEDLNYSAIEWTVDGDAQWSFQDNEIIGKASGSPGFIISKLTYSNFELTLDFFPDSTINSGVFIRCPEPIANPIVCHEINIWDLHPNQENRTGAIVAKAKPKSIVHTLNQWNTYRISCNNDNTEVWVNDVKTAEYRDTSILNGYILLQAAENGEIKFRNIKIAILNQ